MKVLIIGSGMAGLTAAAYFAQHNHQVTVCEQYKDIGGVTATVASQGFHFDIGPLLIEKMEPGGEVTRILKELNISVNLVPGDRSIAFPDFRLERPTNYAGKDWREQALISLFPEEQKGIRRYYRFYEHMMALISAMRNRDMAGRLSPLSYLPLMMHQLAAKKYMSLTAAEMLSRLFKDERLRAVYSGILADFCVLPEEFLGAGLPWCNPETAFDKRIYANMKKALEYPGYSYIKNGTGHMVHAFAKMIRANGGVIMTNSTVTKILVREGAVAGALINGKDIIDADIILASGGAKEVFYELVGAQHLTKEYAARIERAIPMESVLMVHLGINVDPSEYQKDALCYYYGTYDITGSVKRCRDGIFNEADDGYLIYIPSAHSKDMAPPGQHAVTLYTIAPNVLKDGTWEDKGTYLADRLINKAVQHIPPLKDGIQVREVMTPVDFQMRTGMRHHGFGGMAPIMGQKNPAYTTPVKNLYFIGAQSESGGGVAGVMLGARDVSTRILKMQ